VNLELALLERLAHGDREAAGALFDRYAPRVERTLFRILGTDGELPDSVHDVFLRAMRHIGELEDPAAFAAWLMRVTVSTAMDKLRARKRRRWLFLVAPEELPELSAPRLDHEGREALRAVYRILGQLPPEDRTAFSLRVLDGMELADVAHACDCSLATAKRRIARAREHLETAARTEPALHGWVSGGGEP